jgi:hypothetical protein
VACEPRSDPPQPAGPLALRDVVACPVRASHPSTWCASVRAPPPTTPSRAPLTPRSRRAALRAERTRTHPQRRAPADRLSLREDSGAGAHSVAFARIHHSSPPAAAVKTAGAAHAAPAPSAARAVLTAARTAIPSRGRGRHRTPLRHRSAPFAAPRSPPLQRRDAGRPAARRGRRRSAPSSRRRPQQARRPRGRRAQRGAGASDQTRGTLAAGGGAVRGSGLGADLASEGWEAHGPALLDHHGRSLHHEGPAR